MTPSPKTPDTDRGIPACQQAPEPSPSEVLDWQGLQTRCLGNLDFVQRVLDKFQQRLPVDLAELERMAELRDVEQIARVAHRIKGTSANVSAQGLCRAAAEIEDLSRAGCVTDIPLRIAHLRREWERYLDCATPLFSATDADRGNTTAADEGTPATAEPLSCVS
jgi:HPt (histidine-containing phosphotransfer) domain-containing protein